MISIYREQLRQAKELLEQEIFKLQADLATKELDMRKLDGILKEPDSKTGRQSTLTSQIVEALYVLARDSTDGVPARAVVQEFGRQRADVDESTIRSTLYQVTRKLRPTEIMVDSGTKSVRVSKNGSLYGIELVAEEAPQIV